MARIEYGNGWSKEAINAFLETHTKRAYYEITPNGYRITYKDGNTYEFSQAHWTLPAYVYINNEIAQITF